MARRGAPGPVEHPVVRHQLFAPPETTDEAVEILAQARWPAASWQDGVLRLSRYTTIGPKMSVSEVAAVAVGVDPDLTCCYPIDTIEERGDPPRMGALDPSGISRAFSRGLPVREELRIAEWLVSAARRLGGSVRFAPDGVVVTPDVEAAIDLTIYSDVWLEPEAAMAIVSPSLPGAMWGTQYAIETADRPDERAVTLRIEMDETLRKEVLQAADAYDAEVLAGDVVLDGYAIVCDLGEEGVVNIEVGPVEVVPTVLETLPWTRRGVVAYHVGWLPVDELELFREFPTEEHLAVRARMLPLLAHLTAAIYTHTGVEIVDEDGFLVSAEEL